MKHCGKCGQTVVKGEFVHKKEFLCKTCFRQWQIDLHLEDPRKRLLNNARQRSRRFGTEFSIGLDDIIIPNVCPILGIELAPFFKLENKGNRRWAPSLDRIDNSKGYVPGNVAVISWKANSLKGDMSIETVKRLLAYMNGTVTHD